MGDEGVVGILGMGGGGEVGGGFGMYLKRKKGKVKRVIAGGVA